jgi:hypothetical protein
MGFGIILTDAKYARIPQKVVGNMLVVVKWQWRSKGTHAPYVFSTSETSIPNQTTSGHVAWAAHEEMIGRRISKQFIRCATK